MIVFHPTELNHQVQPCTPIVHHFGPDTDPFATISLYGPAHRSDLRTLPIRWGADARQICSFKAASTPKHKGFGKIKLPAYGYSENGFDLYADGVLLTKPNSGAIFGTGDCLAGALYEATTHRLVFFHAGRAALTPRLSNGMVTNIVTNAYTRVTENVTDPQVSAYVTGGICAEHFVHNTTEGRALATPFQEHFGDIAFLDEEHTQLDLVAIISAQLLRLGVPPVRIRHDGICTYETPWLASHRRDGDGRRNQVVAVLHSRS
jgi:copper oxidase (laccase) domain-containing protein